MFRADDNRLIRIQPVKAFYRPFTLFIEESVPRFDRIITCGIRIKLIIKPFLTLFRDKVRAVIEIEVRIKSVRRKYHIRYFLTPFQFRRDLLGIFLGECVVFSELVEEMHPIPFGRVLRTFRNDSICYLPYEPRVLAGRHNASARDPGNIVAVERNLDAFH